MNIKQELICYNRSHQTLSPQGIVLHDTDDAGATAQAEHDYFNSGYRSASAHAFVDWSEIIQCIPWSEVAWGSGPTSNHRYLQVELCVPRTQDAGLFEKVWNNATDLFAYLFVNVLKIHTVSKDNLLSHADVSNRWHETDHQDPVSYFQQYGKTVDNFRAAVQEKINNILNPKEVFDMEKIVTYFGDLDANSAIVVSQKNQCPMMKKADFEASGLKAEQVIQVGGKPGSTRYTSFKDAAALV